MAEAAQVFDAEQIALDNRVDRIVAAHGGNWRGAIETLLIVSDLRAEQISFGYARGRIAGADRQ